MRAIVGVTLLLLLTAGHVYPMTIDFEQFTDSQHLTNQIPGVTFVNTTVATAGISLNEFEFPPHSGKNVALNDGGQITILFSPEITSFSGYFTYADPLKLEAFDDAGALRASATSQFSSNLALSGDPGSSPNEFIRITSPWGLSKVTFAAGVSGPSLAMDDIAFQTLSSTTPEPGALMLLAFGLCLLSALGLRRRFLRKG